MYHFPYSAGANVVRGLFDMPAPVAGIIRLPPGNWVFTNDINLGDNGILCEDAGNYYVSGGVKLTQTAGASVSPLAFGSSVGVAPNKVSCTALEIETASALPALTSIGAFPNRWDYSGLELASSGECALVNGGSALFQSCRFRNGLTGLNFNAGFSCDVVDCQFTDLLTGIDSGVGYLSVYGSTLFYTMTNGILWTAVAASAAVRVSGALFTATTNLLVESAAHATGFLQWLGVFSSSGTNGIDLTAGVPGQGVSIDNWIHQAAGMTPFIGFTAATADVYVRGSLNNGVPMTETAITP